ncbi:Zn-ribbon domain-containing OB-fold protein [Streptococcus orisasini]|uniref:Zn-ribbon domain-containing OB-fold protein n=1 Tax=Streptococcus orisasini TaxID=1080071 RepID=UPI000B0FC69D|nr:zinc ribbon domain-containing protein [Streptococcus orisasini]
MTKLYANEQLSNPIIESSLKDWREQGGLTRLEGSRCEKCGKLFFPRRFVCPHCFSRHLVPYRFSGDGVIKNIECNSIPQVSVIGYRELMPRFLAIITLKEGVDILGEIVDYHDNIEATQLLGKEVKAVVRKQARSGNTSWKYGYKFVLKGEQDA